MGTDLALKLRHTYKRIRGASKRIPNETKNEYRQFYFDADIAQTKIVLLLLAITIAVFAISDYQFLGFSLIFYALEALRLGVIFYSVGELFYIKRLKNYRSYDRSILAYLLVFVVFSLLVNLTRLNNFEVHVIVADISIFVIYLVIPTRFANQVIISSLYSISEVLLILQNIQHVADPVYFTALLSLFFANVVAALTSWQIHSYRWRLFQDFNTRKDSERLATIGQVAGMVGHDIRNPLQTIVSDVYLATTELDTLADSKEKKNLQESMESIQAQSYYIDKIINDLQDLARPLKPEISTVETNVFIDKLLENIPVPDNIKTSAEVEVDVSKLKLDPIFLRRIMTNLITNAVQAMPKGGNLFIKAHRKNGKVLITVEDTGVGIPENVKPKLFTPLVTTKAKGQGFGLPVVKRLVEAHGGSITFESQEGKGTKFVIELPLY